MKKRDLLEAIDRMEEDRFFAYKNVSELLKAFVTHLPDDEECEHQWMLGFGVQPTCCSKCGITKPDPECNHAYAPVWGKIFDEQICVMCGALKPKEESAKPEWEVEFDKLLQYDPSEPAEKRLKQFFREEMKKLGEEIKSKIKLETIHENYPENKDLGYVAGLEFDLDKLRRMVNEVLKERGVK